MSLKLIKASQEYQKQIVEMLEEWIDYNREHPEANTSPCPFSKMIIMILNITKSIWMWKYQQKVWFQIQPIFAWTKNGILWWGQLISDTN